MGISITITGGVWEGCILRISCGYDWYHRILSALPQMNIGQLCFYCHVLDQANNRTYLDAGSTTLLVEKLAKMDHIIVAAGVYVIIQDQCHLPIRIPGNCLCSVVNRVCKTRDEGKLDPRDLNLFMDSCGNVSVKKARALLETRQDASYYDTVHECVEHLQTINLPSVIQVLNGVSLHTGHLEGMALALAQLRTLLLFPDQDIDALIASVRATKDVHWAVLHVKFLRQALIMDDVNLARQWVKNLDNFC